MTGPHGYQQGANMDSHGTDYEADPVAVAIESELERQGYLSPEHYFDLVALAAAARSAVVPSAIRGRD